ncbi:hypothetical protein RFI_01850 [Reticulomyxa filosa]|uniref:Uncharacterized protein n=1 Tax=Reticulomyxa filosa TaxID=46433 RepID=X6PAR7_RETFI|nr:hypothetical protein RFI_01850 [Reticulomyxa filosa]|eukprot:ETO35223.1 hypothetical protein RFI_01850 [Reticulomyxa filosa]
MSQKEQNQYQLPQEENSMKKVERKQSISMFVCVYLCICACCKIFNDDFLDERLEWLVQEMAPNQETNLSVREERKEAEVNKTTKNDDEQKIRADWSKSNKYDRVVQLQDCIMDSVKADDFYDKDDVRYDDIETNATNKLKTLQRNPLNEKEDESEEMNELQVQRCKFLLGVRFVEACVNLDVTKVHRLLEYWIEQKWDVITPKLLEIVSVVRVDNFAKHEFQLASLLWTLRHISAVNDVLDVWKRFGFDEKRSEKRFFFYRDCHLTGNNDKQYNKINLWTKYNQ